MALSAILHVLETESPLMVGKCMAERPIAQLRRHSSSEQGIGSELQESCAMFGDSRSVGDAKNSSTLSSEKAFDGALVDGRRNLYRIKHVRKGAKLQHFCRGELLLFENVLGRDVAGSVVQDQDNLVERHQ